MSLGNKYNGKASVPKLSAAIATPPLNLTAMTEVPVTAGDCVCVWGAEVWRYEWS